MKKMSRKGGKMMKEIGKASGGKAMKRADRKSGGNATSNPMAPASASSPMSSAAGPGTRPKGHKCD
jgi:hypothetical protein